MQNISLMEKYRQYPFRWLATKSHVGQIAAIDIAYRTVSTDYIFHCEDDWEFTAPAFIEKSLAILESHGEILQVCLRALNDTNGHPVLGKTFAAGDVPYRLLAHHYDAGKWGTWHGLSWNPGLRRRRDYDLIGSFGMIDPDGNKLPWEVERDASVFYQQRGLYAAILADNDGQGYVRHIGGGRHVPEETAAALQARFANAIVDVVQSAPYAKRGG